MEKMRQDYFLDFTVGVDVDSAGKVKGEVTDCLPA
jgi:hypothetical protein